MTQNSILDGVAANADVIVDTGYPIDGSASLKIAASEALVLSLSGCLAKETSIGGSVGGDIKSSSMDTSITGIEGSDTSITGIVGSVVVASARDTSITGLRGEDTLNSTGVVVLTGLAMVAAATASY